jgi:predicted DCC family thiol-disulfide oxidoreductase YuxK
MRSNTIIFFDGICTLCNGWVRFVIHRDKNDVFSFAALQSDAAKKLLGSISVDDKNSSIMLMENEKIYTQSTAVLRIFRYLSGFWSLLYIFIIVPPFIRNEIYRFVACNRYRWFGKKENCMIPSKSVAHKFLY